MKITKLITITFLTLLTISSYAQNKLVLDLHDMVKNKSLVIVNREISLINETSHLGISLSKDYGEGVAWLKGIEFSNGIIEFDVRGEDIKQHSFVGFAFHGKDDSTFDAIYLRPFQFREKDEIKKNRAIQYISLPKFSWRILREMYPNKYEHSIEPAPDPNSWVSVRIIIKDSTITTYINGNTEPSLIVQKVTQVKSGSIGFYVADTSGGDFANISITKTN